MIKLNKKYYIHEKAIVETKQIGEGTKIWAFVHILDNVKIGKNCNICDHCFIENGVEVGNNVTIKCGIYIWKGAKIKDNVFLGPNVVFTNDIFPRSKKYPQKFEETIIENGASIGANVTIVAGIKIGKYSLVGAGSVVTKDIPPYNLWYGNPAKFKGYVCECGVKLVKCKKDFICNTCGSRYKLIKNKITKVINNENPI
jgi:acetyltransferase-like isoleucine patch superfamily enzyme